MKYIVFSQGANTIETVGCVSLAKPLDDTAVILASGDVWGSKLILQSMTLYGKLKLCEPDVHRCQLYSTYNHVLQ